MKNSYFAEEDSDGDEEDFEWGGCRGGGSSGYRRGGMSPVRDG